MTKTQSSAFTVKQTTPVPASKAAMSSEPHQFRREGTFRNLHTYNKISSTPSGANCTCSSRGGVGGVGMKKTFFPNGAIRATWKKQSCKSGFFCPRCSPISAIQNLQRTIIATEQHIANGDTAIFITLTNGTKASSARPFINAEFSFRHSPEYTLFKNADRGNPAKGRLTRLAAAVGEFAERNALPLSTHKDWELYKRLEAQDCAMRSTFGGKAWTQEAKKYGVVGRITVIELVPTPAIDADGNRDWGRVAHNLHRHIIIYIKGTPSEKAIAQWMDKVVSRYVNRSLKEGLYTSKKAQDYQAVAGDDLRKVASYINKFSATAITGTEQPADEADRTATVFDALKDAGGGYINANGNIVPASKKAKNWFRQCEQVFKSRKKFSTTPYFYERLGVAEKIAAMDEDFKKNTISQEILSISQNTWMRLGEENPEYKYELLNMAENTTNEVLYEFLEEQGYDFVKAEPFSLDDIEDDEVAEYRSEEVYLSEEDAEEALYADLEVF